MILLETRREMKNMVEDKKLFIDEELTSLQLTQIKHVKDIKRELNISVTILITTFIKNITSEITLIEKDDITNTVVYDCSNKIKYMIKLCIGLLIYIEKKMVHLKLTLVHLKLLLVHLKLKLKLILVHLKLIPVHLKLILVHLKLKLILVHLKLKLILVLLKLILVHLKLILVHLKTNDKVDIENHRSEIHKTINNIKTILDCFASKKIMNEKFITRSIDKDGISLCSINKSMKGVKIINKIAISNR